MAGASNQMADAWTPRLTELGFKPGPRDGCRLEDEDGVYFFFADEGARLAHRSFQLVVVGPMRLAPREIERLIGPDVEVVDVQALPPAPDATREQRRDILGRGFTAVYFMCAAEPAREAA